MVNKLITIGLTILLSFTWTWSHAQEKKGFVGVAIGTSHILNTTSVAKVGANLNLINAGYEFRKGFGLTFKWLGSAHVNPDEFSLG